MRDMSYHYIIEPTQAAPATGGYFLITFNKIENYTHTHTHTHTHIYK